MGRCRRVSPQKNDGSDSPKARVAGIIGSFSALAALFVRRVSRASGKPRAALEPAEHHQPPRTPRSRPKVLLETIGSKTAPFLHWGKEPPARAAAAEEEGFGDGGVWQRAILMGDKCQPPEFSGVIYYDSNGNQVAALPPKSPRASPFLSYYDRRF